MLACDLELVCAPTFCLHLCYACTIVVAAWWPQYGTHLPPSHHANGSHFSLKCCVQFASQIDITDFYIYRTAIRSAMAKEATRKPRARMATLFTAIFAAFRPVRCRLRTKVFREEEDLIDEFDAIAMAATVLKERLVTVEQDHKKRDARRARPRPRPLPMP